MSRPFPPVWMPGERGYKEHMDRYVFSYDNISAIKAQTNQLKTSLNQQSNDIRESIIGSNEQLASSIDDGFSRLSNNIIASNNQLATSIDEGFDQLSFINERGFNQVTSAIENLNSDFNYFSGVIIQKLEYQNILLNGILQTLQQPFETQVKEYYRKGCLFVQQEFLRGAVDCFKESISLRMGDYFFPSHFQLGLIYLSGVSEGLSFVDVNKANEYLLKANSIGNREIKTNPAFKQTLADCKFFLSQSFYSKLTKQNTANELELINNAIRYCQEATDLNPNLSHGWYHLAKYKSYRLGQFKQYSNDAEIDESLVCFLKAVEIDRNYLRTVLSQDPFYDKALLFLKEPILNLIVRLTELKKNEASIELSKAINNIKLLEGKNIGNSTYKYEFNQLKDTVISSEKDFNSNTYFGFDDCLTKLCAL
jgi:tetratricopeptide (TPR) repeat protein